MTGSKREQRRLAAAEEVCRAFRKAITCYSTEKQYMSVALDWLQVWIKNSPADVWQSEPTQFRKKTKAAKLIQARVSIGMSDVRRRAKETD